MTKLKDNNRKDPVLASGAAKMQQEVVPSMSVLHNMHHAHTTAEGANEISLEIFEFAKKGARTIP